MKSILAIIALSAYVTASPLGSTSAPTETVPAMPLATAEWDEKMVLDGCEEEFFRFATVWKKDNKAKAVLRSSYHPATEEIIVTPEETYYVTDDSGEIECFRGFPWDESEDFLQLEYIRSEFLDGQLTDYFLDRTLYEFTKPVKNYMWLDASTGVPVKRTGFFDLGGPVPFTNSYGNYTTIVDDSEFSISKHLECKVDSDYVKKMYREKFAAALL